MSKPAVNGSCALQTELQTDAPVAGTPVVPASGVSFAPATEQVPGDPAGEETLPEPTDRRSSDGAGFDGADRRKNVVDVRTGLNRRVLDIGSPTGLERRRGPGRRRSDDRRSAEEGEMSDEQFEFVMAVDTYKRLNNRPFPSWTEVLEIVKQLGYRKVAASSIRLPNNNGPQRPTNEPVLPGTPNNIGIVFTYVASLVRRGCSCVVTNVAGSVQSICTEKNPSRVRFAG